MIRTFTLLFLTVFASMIARAGYTPVTVTGFNKDVVANGTGPIRSSAVSVDDKRDTSGYSFLTQDYRSLTNAAPSTYLPQNGLISSAATVGLTYQLASYSANNSLRLDSTGRTGTLTVTNPVNASDIYLLATSGGAGTSTSDANVLITFTDGTTTSTTLSVRDWYNYTVVAYQGFSRADMTTGKIDTNTTNPRLYEYKLTLASTYYSKSIQSIQFTRTNATGLMNIMAVSVNTISPCGAPVNQPANLQLTPTVYGVAGSFTASVPPANKYMVLRALTTAGGPDTPPVDGQTYTVGSTLGNATIISVSASTTFSDPGLTIGTNYTYLVLGFSDSTCYGISPAYNIANPLTGSATIPSCSATPGGTYTVGPTGTYPNLSAAMTALNNAAGASGNVIVELQPAYTSTNETFPINVPNISSSPCASGNPTLIIRPAAGATGLVIAGKSIAPLLDFNGARRVTLDGRPGGTGTTSQLTINNDSTAGVAIRIANDAAFNTITYCDIQGRNTNNTSGTTLSGVVYFGQANATTLNGNDYNTISNSSIHGNANGTPAIGISAYGTTTRKVNYNDSCTITNCNIYDFFNAGTASTGIKLDAGNNAWTINANNLYQTATRTYTTAATHRGFWITPNTGSIDSTASGFIITNNFIGGSAVAAGGAAYTMTGTVGSQFSGMDISVGYAVPTSVQNNTLSNLSFTSSATSTSGIFIGIGTANGNVNIGNLVGNTIGSGTGTGAITITTGSASTGFGIRVGGSTTLSTTNVANNVIGSISVTGASAVSSNFIGIGTSGGASTTVSNNLIGSLTTPASISIGASTATTAQVLTGINLANGTTTNVLNNTIANLVNNHATITATTTASQVRGIAVSAGATTIFGNTVRSLTNSSIQTSSGASAAVLGISMTSTTAGATVTGNKVYTLKSTAAAAAVNVVGMYIGSAATGLNLFNKNIIHSLSATTTASGAFITGMDIGAGNVTVVNNMLRLGIDSSGAAITTPLSVRGITRGGTATASKFYFNSIYVGGTGVAATATTATYAFQRNATPGSGADSIMNNIFVNARSNSATGGGKHYAIYLVTSANNLGANFNTYYTPGTGGTFGYNGTADATTYANGWIASDINSIYGDPKFIAPTGTEATVNLHIATGTPTPIESAGIPIPGLTDDYDGDTRASLTPTDIGADAGNFIAQDLSSPLISYTPLDYTCLTTNRTITATIADATGIPTTGALVPRIYFRKGTGTWFSAPGTLASGTATNGTWSFTISASALGGVAAGDQISYYIIAQDAVNPTNIGASPGAGLVASDVNNVTTQPTTPNIYNVANGPLPAAIAVTPASATFCVTTGSPVKLKATGGAITGNLVAGTAAAQNTTTGYPSPFSNYYGGSRHQFLVLASELTAAGFAAGTPLQLL